MTPSDPSADSRIFDSRGEVHNHPTVSLVSAGVKMIFPAVGAPQAIDSCANQSGTRSRYMSLVAAVLGIVNASEKWKKNG